jgi:hypothetical protein
MRRTMHRIRLDMLFALTGLCLLGGCSSLVSSVTQGFADDLSAAILNNDDLAMVRDGAPSFLLLVDSLVARSPEDSYMLQQSAKLHTAYAAVFVTDEDRSKLLHAKAKRQALAAACYGLRKACGLDQRPFKEFARWLDTQRKSSAPQLYDLAVTWVGWIQANSDDFNAVAELARVKEIMLKTAMLEPAYDSGGVFLYLGVLETLFPPSLGGKPEVGRRYFERAIEASNGQNLMAKVMFAEQYARLVFDRALHDELLAQVMASPVAVDGLTLMNTVAQEQAQQLMESANEYF